MKGLQGLSLDPTPSVGTVEAVFLNTRCRGGYGKLLWEQILRSSEAAQLGFSSAQVLEMSILPQDQVLDRAKDWAAERIKEGCQNFVAVGGDGTVHLAVNALFPHSNSKPRLGAVAAGSSNDFHKGLNPVARGRFLGLPYRLAFDSAFLHDLCEVRFVRPSGVSELGVFAINSSLGLTAQANARFSRNGLLMNWMKKVSVSTAISWAALSELISFQAQSVGIEWDSEPLRSFRITNLGVVKNHQFAGDFHYDIHSLPDDGELGLHLLGVPSESENESISLFQRIRAAIALKYGRFSELPNAVSRKCKSVSVFGDEPFSLELDGEIKTCRSVHFRILPKEMYLCP